MSKVLNGIICTMLSISMISPFISPASIRAEEEEIVEKDDELIEEFVEEQEEIEVENETVIASGKCGVSVYWQINDDGQLLITGNAEMYDYSPEGAPWYSWKNQINSIEVDFGVTTIGDCAFYGLNYIAPIHISNTVTTIGVKAFSHFGEENSLYIPSSVVRISEETFSYSKLEITFSDSITIIPDCAFEGIFCSTINLPASLKCIGNNAFYGAFIYGELAIPKTVTDISDYAFYGANINSVMVEQGSCADRLFDDGYKSYYEEVLYSGKCGKNTKWVLSDDGTLTLSGEGEVTSSIDVNDNEVKKVVIGADILDINIQMLRGFDNLSSIIVDPNNSIYDSRENCNAIIETSSNTLLLGCNDTIIPNTVTKIGYFAFSGCTMAKITIPNSVKNIQGGAFMSCNFIKGITIPSSVKVIGDCAFQGCSSLVRVSLSEGLIDIGKWAFEDTNIRCLEIPSTVILIRSEFVNKCFNLESITFQGEAPTFVDILFNTISENHYGNENYKDIKIYYPSNDSTWTQSVRENCIPKTVEVSWIPSSIYESELEGYYMTLQKNEVIMNYCYSLSSTVVKNGSEIYLQFTRPNGTVKNVYVNKASTEKIDGKIYYLFPCDVSAKDMTGIIKAQMVFPDGRTTTEDLYSVEESATKIINGSSFSENEKKIAKAMLTYGKYVQQYFNYNMSRLPKNVNTLEDVSFTDSKYDYKTNLKNKSDSVTYVGSRLELTSSMKLKLYFRVTGSKSYFFNGSTPITSATTAMTLSTEGNYKVITISNITDLSKLYTIRYGTSSTYSSSKNSVLKYSVYNYGYEAYRQNKTSLVNLLKAMDCYYKVFN